MGRPQATHPGVAGWSAGLRRARALALVLGVALLAVGPAAGQAPDGEPEVSRLAGADRFATAATVSAATFEPGVATAYVATGEDFPDALAVGPVAGVDGAPVLLVTRDQVPQATAAELQRLAPGRVVVLGGDAAVADTVLDELAAHAGAVERLAGADRFATAAAVSASRFSPGVPVVYVATGLAFPDALAGGAAGAAAGGPVLLVDDTLPAATAAELERLEPRSIAVLGGPAAVSEAVADELAAYAGEVRRVAGGDRVATAAAVARDAFPEPAGTVFVATAADHPDALSGAPAAAAAAAPVLLVRGGCVPPVVADELDRLTPSRVVLLGGTAALPAAVARLAGCGLEVSVLASGLEAPWDVTFAPDGRAFISERDSGAVLVRQPDGSLEELTRFEVDARGEGGLLGLAVSSTFADDQLLYAYLTTAEDNRIVRWRPGETPEPVLTGIPRANFHNGGRIAFGPDGLLYATTGDAGEPPLAQDPESLAGKVLRLTADGGAPDDNPSAGSVVYALGLRNVQGLAWDADGRLYATEFGPDVDDEVNLIVPGGNYGWPEVTGAAGADGFVDPVVVRQPPVASWSGAAVLRDGAVADWEGDLFVAALRGQRLWRFALGADGSVTDAEELLVEEYGRLRHVTQAPDGALWVLTSNRDGRGSPAADDDRVVRVGPPPR